MLDGEWRIVVADERHLTRRALVHLLRSRLPESQVQEGGTQEEVGACLTTGTADLLLVDATAPGLGILPQLRQLCPTMKVVVMTGYDQPEEALRSAQAGAHGYLVRGIHPDEFLRCLRAILETEVLVFSPALGEALGGPALPVGTPNEQRARLIRSESVSEFRPATSVMEGLSRREREIFELMVQNLSNKEIAAQLMISEQTVKAHVSRILVKLGQPNRAKAVIHAVRTGLQEASRIRQ